MLFASNEEILAMADDLEKWLMPRVQGFIEARDLAEKQIAGLMNQIGELREKAENLKTEAAALREKGAELAMSGKSPLEVNEEIRANERTQGDVQDWISQLEDKLASLNVALVEAARKLYDAAEAEINEGFALTLSEEINQHLKQATVKRAAYLSAVRLVIQKLLKRAAVGEKNRGRTVNRASFPLKIRRDFLFEMKEHLAGEIY
jgi:chromosome segregation ATPase